MPETIVNYVKPPLLLIQSLFDKWQEKCLWFTSPQFHHTDCLDFNRGVKFTKPEGSIPSAFIDDGYSGKYDSLTLSRQNIYLQKVTDVKNSLEKTMEINRNVKVFATKESIHGCLRPTIAHNYENIAVGSLTVKEAVENFVRGEFESVVDSFSKEDTHKRHEFKSSL